MTETDLEDVYYDEHLPKMNDYLDQFTEEELDIVADKVVRYVAFCSKYMKNEKGKPLIIEWHQLLWVSHLMLHIWSMVLGPRGHGKSTAFTSWMLFEICEDPRLRFLIASHIEELAEEFSLRVQSYLEPQDPEPPLDEPYLIRDYDLHKGKKWTGKRAYFATMTYPFVKVVAVKGGMTGGRYDIGVFDDPFTDLSIDTEKMRRKFKRWVNKAVLPSLDETDKQKCVVIGTRKNVEDWYQDCIDNPEFTCHIDQLYSIEDGKKTYLWPAVPFPGEDKIKDHAFNEQREKKKRNTMSAGEFAMEMMNRPVSEKGILFHESWLSPYYHDDWREAVPEKFREIYIGIDPSLGSESDVASYFGLAVVCYDNRPERQMIYVVDLVREKMSMAEQEEVILQKYREWQPDYVQIEEEVAVRQFSKQVRSRLPPNVRPVFYSKGGKTTGLRGTSVIAKKKRINQVFGMLAREGKISFKNPRIDRNTRDFLNHEYLQFPEGKLDLMDALNMAVDLVDFRKTITSDPLQWLQ